MADIGHSVFGGQSQLQPFQQVDIDFSASGDNIIVAAVAGQIVRMYRIAFVVGGATNLEFKDGAGTVLSGPYVLTASQAVVFDYTFAGMPPWFTTSAGNALIINSSQAVLVGGHVDFIQS